MEKDLAKSLKIVPTDLVVYTIGHHNYEQVDMNSNAVPRRVEDIIASLQSQLFSFAKGRLGFFVLTESFLYPANCRPDLYQVALTFFGRNTEKDGDGLEKQV
jgi:hypothetical protein